MKSKKRTTELYGGAAVRLKKTTFRLLNLTALAFLLAMLLSASALAQGSIFGSVTNSNVTTPANGEITFVGFLDDTDEEIRIETSDGAGYDAGNWFDDFQNYLTEAPGNPYDYYFYNIANNEGFHLASTIPNNSFQQEDILLAPAAWPAAPTGLSTTTVSTSSIVVSWDAQPGLTYHVYRRVATSNGSFFRRDNTSGSLADPGVSTNYFVDNGVDGVSNYQYLVIAEDASGNLSPHSELIVGGSAAPAAPVVDSIVPNHGPAVGNTLVAIYGSGFDVNGVNPVVGTVSLTGITIVSPFQITGLTQAGTIGTANVSVTNVASTLGSNVLTGAYTYDANTPPTLAAITTPQTVNEGELLTFNTSATDPDGGNPVMTASTLPGSATYDDNGDGTGAFNWQTTFTDAGSYDIWFYATDNIDPLLVDSQLVTIDVAEVGNQAPIMDPIADTTIPEGGSLFLLVSASDPDGEIPNLSASNLPTNATFLDNSDGTGDFNFNPDLTQEGIYNVVFKALDADLAVDSIVVQITVSGTNQEPVLATIDPQSTTENVLLQFLVTATDGDGPVPVLTTSTLPGTATFTDSLNGVGLFEWTPSFTDSGSYPVTFYAEDGAVTGVFDSQQVIITVIDAGNQTPVLDSIGDTTIAEGSFLMFLVTATDDDGTIPTLSVLNLPANAFFADSGNGTGYFEFAPDFNQGGLYTVTFVADDGLLADSQDVNITVADLGNLAPVFGEVADTAVNEGETLVLVVTATDPDGGGEFPVLSINTSLVDYNFVDSGNGVGVLTYTPNYYDAGSDEVTFLATDNGTPQQTGVATITILTRETNMAPQFVDIGPFGAAIGLELSFDVEVTDSTDQNTAHRVLLSVQSGPIPSSTWSFVDNQDNTGTFTFVADSSQIGTNTVTFLAVDQGSPALSTTFSVDLNVILNNVAPVFDTTTLDPKIIVEGQALNVIVDAYDPDSTDGTTIPALSAKHLPDNASFVDQGTGTGLFNFTPDYVQGGSLGASKIYWIEFQAFDGVSVGRRLMLIQVNDAGDQAPVFDSIPTGTVMEGETLDFTISGYDPDTLPVTFTVVESTLPENATFTDNGDGTATIYFNPNFMQFGTYGVDIIISDGSLETTATFTINVEEAGNQDPVLQPISDQTFTELTTLTFDVFAEDPDGDSTVTLSTSALPSVATFTDLGTGQGTFDWTATDTDAGTYSIMFYADDGLVIDSQGITITVVDTNRVPHPWGVIPPSRFPPGYPDGPTITNRFIYEGDTLYQLMGATDPDGTIPEVRAHLSGTETLAPNMSLVDSLNGSGLVTFTPDYTQGSGGTGMQYYLVFEFVDAADSTLRSYTGESAIQITVLQRNQPPGMVFVDAGTFLNPDIPITLNEGTSIDFLVGGYDPDSPQLPTSLSAFNLPTNATFIDYTTLGDTLYNFFEFNPDFTQAGSYSVGFVVTDVGGGADTQFVDFDVIEAGNQIPTFSHIDSAYNVPLGSEFRLLIEADDPDLDSVILTADPIMNGATFVDSGNGHGCYFYTPDSSLLNTFFKVTFIATDYPTMVADSTETYFLIVNFLRGDLDANNRYSLNDLSFLINYLYRHGPPPEVIEAADINDDATLNIVDVTYMIKFLYHNGPQPPQ